MYTYYVIILGIPENTFWNAELSDLLSIVANKTAYDKWFNAERERLSKK